MLQAPVSLISVAKPLAAAAAGSFVQPLNPAHSTLGSTLVALVPIVLLLVLLPVLRMSAWQAVIIGALVTIILAIAVWGAPAGDAFGAWGVGAGTGFWSIDWITFWGVVIYNTLVRTGAFGDFKRWLIGQATADVRVQAILLAWALGALLEGLVGFGYPWAVIAPILVGFGVLEIDAIRVAAIANNAPVSFGALGAPIIALAAVTKLPLDTLAASVGRIVAVLALLPPWILIVLVTGRRGLRGAWPLAVVGSLSYILGQLPTSQFLGPYLPDIVGAVVSFGALLLLLRWWRPKETLGYGGVPIDGESPAMSRTDGGASPAATPGPPPGPAGAATRVLDASAAAGTREAVRGLVPFGILIAVVVAATGPWSHLSDYDFVKPAVTAISSLSGKPDTVAWEFAPAVAGTWIMVSWLLIVIALRATPGQVADVFRVTFRQMWGALLVAPIIFGLADVFNYSGMASTMAHGFSRIGPAFLILAPIVGWIGVALSGSNTSTNALFGGFQYSVGGLLHMPPLLLPSLNSVGAEIGKPVAPQTASVGISTTGFVRHEGQVIRHNLAWTLVILAWLILIGLFYRGILPAAMRP
ncbi:MAG TPA: L-lactate permease [Streptosporangiaceae bacterium]|nr:L-lactate permease [Streptosporangiaceae bacterium]